MQLFSDLGYDATTTKLIAKKAKVNEALIHRYFESKQGLLLALFHHIKASAEVSALTNPPAETLEAELVQFFRLRNRLAVEKEKHMRLIVSRAVVDPKLAAELDKKICGDHGMPGLLERLQYWRDKGEVSPHVNLDHACYSVSGNAFVTSFFGQLIFKTPSAELDERIRAMSEILAAGLRHFKK